MDCMLTFQGVRVRLLHPVSNDSLSRTNNIVNEIKEKKMAFYASVSDKISFYIVLFLMVTSQTQTDIY